MSGTLSNTDSGVSTNSPWTGDFRRDVLTLLVIVRWLRQLWWDKMLADVLLRGFELEPEEYAKLVTTTYFAVLRVGPAEGN